MELNARNDFSPCEHNGRLPATLLQRERRYPLHFSPPTRLVAAFRGFVWDPFLPPISAHPFFTRRSFRERRSHLENRAGSHLLRRGMQIAKCVTRFMRRIPKKATGSPALARGYKSALVAAISFRSHSESRGERDITHGPRNSRQVNKSAATRARARARERERCETERKGERERERERETEERMELGGILREMLRGESR